MSRFSLSRTIEPQVMPSAFCVLEKGTHSPPLSQRPPIHQVNHINPGN